MLLRRFPSSGYTLRTALVLSVLLPTVVLLGALGAYALHAVEQRVEARMREDIELIARAIAKPVTTALVQGPEHTLAPTLASAFEFGRVYSAYVYDQAGRLVATGGSTKASLTGSRAVRVAERDGQQGGFDDVEGEKIYSYFVPLTGPGGQIAGLLQVTRRGTDFREYLERVRLEGLAAVGVAALALVLVLVTGYYRAFGRHLQAIDHSMARIREGDHGHRVAERGPEELRVLGHGINAMLDALAYSAKELERRRERESALNARLRQSEKLAAVGQIAAGVAHELGTPLAVIDGKAQRALRRDDHTAGHRETLKAIRTEVARMGSTVHQLLASGRGRAQRERAQSLEAVARAVQAQVADEAAAAGVRLVVAGEGAAPRMRVDRHRLEQALANLVRNGIQAAAGDGQVRVHWFTDATGFGYRVEDSGPGIDPMVRDRLFEPFVTTKQVGEGTGLGLSVAAAAVAAHDGSIDVVDSALGGAGFQIHFPASRTAS